MEKNEFEKNGRAAKQMSQSAEPLEQDFWAGYLRGLRRNYHGENFGTAGDHVLWMSAADSIDQSRRIRGTGYRAGFSGIPISEALKRLEEIKNK